MGVRAAFAVMDSVARTRARGADRRRVRARSSSASASRPSRPARRSTWPRASSRPRAGRIVLGPAALGSRRARRGRGRRPARVQRPRASPCGRGAPSGARQARALRGLDGAVHRPRARARPAENTFARAVRDRRARLFTVYGEPGIGKSRLVSEFVEGATAPPSHRPLSAVRRGHHLLAARRDGQVRRRDHRRRPARDGEREAPQCCETRRSPSCSRSRPACSARRRRAQPAEITWAVRALAEELAEAQPLCSSSRTSTGPRSRCSTLIEHLAGCSASAAADDLSRPARAARRCARLGRRPRRVRRRSSSSRSARPRAASSPTRCSPSTISRRRRASPSLEQAEGNPLFVEETVRMLVHEEAGTAASPTRCRR